MALNPLAEALLTWFAAHGRKQLPWRTGRDPYRVAVSEFMLQQTQVERVVPAFVGFTVRFPSFATLAAASQADVVRAWKGLGYNSRAMRLHRLARVVRDEFAGALPANVESLERLPGVGPYTARAIGAFAYDADVVAADTNVRRIVHRTQYGLEWPPQATVRELDALAGRLLPRGQAFAFNSALMDLGAALCTARAPKCLLCPLVNLCAAAPIDPAALAVAARTHAKPGSPQERVRFRESTRFVRGRIIDRLRQLAPRESISLLDLHRQLVPLLAGDDEAAFRTIVQKLAADGVVAESEGSVFLVS